MISRASGPRLEWDTDSAPRPEARADEAAGALSCPRSALPITKALAEFHSLRSWVWLHRASALQYARRTLAAG
jgi:hypothetical protein